MSCPNTASEIINQLCGLHYLPGTSGKCCKYHNICNKHFERWLETEPEVQKIHEEWMKLKES